MKTTRNNFNVTSTSFRNGVKIGNFVFTLTNVRFYVLPMREIILAILTSSLVVRFSLSPKRLILGVSLTSNLSWNTQTQKVVNKANKIVSFLKRNVGAGNKEVFSRLYTALVIPILEYAVPLWSPYLQKNIDALERVQRRASKYALPSSQCHLLNLPAKKDWQCLGGSIKEVLSIFARMLQGYSWS